MILLIYFVLVQGQGTDIQQDTIRTDTVDVVEYQAKKIIYDLEESIIILIDSSTFRYKDIMLTSDSAYYFIDNNILEAFGECDLRQLDDSIKGEYLRYNIENKKAMMAHGITQIDKGFLDGKEIYWIDEKTVNAYNGKYRELKMIFDGVVYFFHSLGRVLDELEECPFHLLETVFGNF